MSHKFASSSKHKPFFNSKNSSTSSGGSSSSTSFFGGVSPKNEKAAGGMSTASHRSASAHRNGASSHHTTSDFAFSTQNRFHSSFSAGGIGSNAHGGKSLPSANTGSLHSDLSYSTKNSRWYSFLIFLVTLAQVVYMSFLLLRFKNSGYQADVLDDRDLLMEISWQKALKIYLVAYWIFYVTYFVFECVSRCLFGRRASGMSGMGSQNVKSRAGAVNSLLKSLRKEWVHRVYLVVSSVSHFMSALLILHRIRLRQRDEVNPVNVHFMLKDTFVLFTSSLVFDLLFPLILQKLYWKWRITTTEEELRNPQISKRVMQTSSSALHLYKAQYQSFLSVNSSRFILIARILIDYLNLMGCYLFVYYTGHLEPGSIMKKMATGLCVFYHVALGPLFFLYSTNSFMRIHEWYSPSESSLFPKRLEDVYKKYVVYLSIMLLSRNFISVCIDVPFLIFKTLHSSYVYIDGISSICMALTVVMVSVLLIFFWLPFIVGIGSIFCCCCDLLNWRCFRRMGWIDLANAALPITSVPSDILPDGSRSILRED